MHVLPMYEWHVGAFFLLLLADGQAVIDCLSVFANKGHANIIQHKIFDCFGCFGHMMRGVGMIHRDDKSQGVAEGSGVPGYCGCSQTSCRNRLW